VKIDYAQEAKTAFIDASPPETPLT